MTALPRWADFMNTKQEAISFFHSLERFGVCPGLERIHALCDLLGNPERSLKCIHVAGTNGKGTVCTEISNVLREAGYKTGLYVSPYVIDFCERIQINNCMIDDVSLVDAASKVQRAVRSLNEKGVFPTEFEAVTAAAFLCFQSAACDIVVLEVGLGGRYDATNVIKSPVVSVITSISLDHVKLLGDTVAKIAYEKCGIIKPMCYTVTGATQNPEALRVIRNSAAEKHSFLFEADGSQLFSVLSEDIGGTSLVYRGLEIRLPFPGKHQLENASIAVKALEVIGVNGFDITPAHIKKGLEASFNPARTEVLCLNPLIILDGSHNEGSVTALRMVLDTFLPGKKLIAVIGMMADKDIETAVSRLCPRFDMIITVTPGNPRALSSADFARLLTEKGLSAVSAGDPVTGVDTALNMLKEFDGLIVCGSLYLAADVRTHLIEIISQKFQ